MTKMFTWSEYTHWHLKLRWPSDGWDETRVVFNLGLWHLFVQIPLWKTTPWAEWGHEAPQYGIAYHNDTFWIYHGADKWWTFDMPWQWTIVRHDLLLPNGDLYHRNKYPQFGRGRGVKTRSWYDVFESDPGDVQIKVADYVALKHKVSDNIIQEAVIRLCGEEREWRWKWFTWFPFFGMIQRTINCESPIELGSKAGSWKGGMMGWGTDWKHDETMEQAFWRWYKTWDGT